VKVPFFIANGVITAGTLTKSLYLLPLVPVGVWLGVWLNRRFNETWFIRVVLVTLLVLAAPWSVRRAADGLAHPARAAAVGLLSLAVWLALMVLALGSATTAPGVVAVLTGVGLLLAVKLVGVAGLAWLTGRRLARLLPVALRGEVARTGLAMLLLAVLALLPVVGELLWVVAGVTGIGAVVTAWARPVPVLVAAARALT